MALPLTPEAQEMLTRAIRDMLSGDKPAKYPNVYANTFTRLTTPACDTLFDTRTGKTIYDGVCVKLTGTNADKISFGTVDDRCRPRTVNLVRQPDGTYKPE